MAEEQDIVERLRNIADGLTMGQFIAAANEIDRGASEIERLLSLLKEGVEAVENAISLFGGGCTDAPQVEWLRFSRSFLSKVNET